jgi:hypothetical protein
MINTYQRESNKYAIISFKRNADCVKVGYPVASQNVFCKGKCLQTSGKQMHAGLCIQGVFHRIITKFKDNCERNEIQEMLKQN